MPSPIERMIDAACGVESGDFVVLECPQCHRRKTVPRDPSDPPGTARVVATCDCCDHGGNKELVEYFDAADRQILYGD